eukprot:COSAG02_NODE_80_length_40128_cov_591.169002_11_plen_130_part_00
MWSPSWRLALVGVLLVRTAVQNAAAQEEGEGRGTCNHALEMPVPLLLVPFVLGIAIAGVAVISMIGTSRLLKAHQQHGMQVEGICVHSWTTMSFRQSKNRVNSAFHLPLTFSSCSSFSPCRLSTPQLFV